uniref:Uncharacterized protein n=1 Tax=Mustela putorius furo TaxID=9669 RepID=M3YGP0_MUSPF
MGSRECGPAAGTGAYLKGAPDPAPHGPGAIRIPGSWRCAAVEFRPASPRAAAGLPSPPPAGRLPAGAGSPVAALLGKEHRGDPGRELHGGDPWEDRRGETQECSLQKGWAQ